MNTREVLFKKNSTREQERVARAYREAVPLAISAALSLPDSASDEDRDNDWILMRRFSLNLRRGSQVTWTRPPNLSP